jgi:hypothetical protein
MKARPQVMAAPSKPPRPANHRQPLAPGSSLEGNRDELALPHDRDEKPGQTASKPAPEMKQAYEDIKAGQVDTDLRATPGLDARRRRALLQRR